MQSVPNLQLDQQLGPKIKAQRTAVSRSSLSYARSFIDRLPPIEAIMEILVTKADPSAIKLLREEPLCIVNDMTSLLSGYTISYLEFS